MREKESSITFKTRKYPENNLLIPKHTTKLSLGLNTVSYGAKKLSLETKTIKGQIHKILYYNPESQYAVLQVQIPTISGSKLELIKGTCLDLKLLPSLEYAVGLNFSAVGKWENHSKYGNQFKASIISITFCNIVEFLSTMISGIGPALVKRIVDYFGEEQLKIILDSQPEKLLEIKGIKQKKLQKIVKSWQKVRALQLLSSFFMSRGISLSRNTIFKIYRHFTSENRDPIAEIQSNPYCLTEIEGIGFKTADSLALKLGIAHDSEQRIEALLNYILSEEALNNGHTFLPIREVINNACKYIKTVPYIVKDLENKIYNILSNSTKYYFDGEKVALFKYYLVESKLAEIIKDKITTSFKKLNKNFSGFSSSNEAEEFIALQEKKLGIKFDPDQREALKKFIENKPLLFLLCGYAGTGKTTVSKAILEYCSTVFPRTSIITCAPTGIASRRVSEMTNFPGLTIHSLLGYNPQTKKFLYDEDNPLPYNVVLVDEASMINLPLFYSLLKSIRKDCVLILVGDNAQLPPIGEGNVFSDLLNKKEVLKAKLQQIHRQSNRSVIPYFASYIRKGVYTNQLISKHSDYEFDVKDINHYWRLKRELKESEMQEERKKLYMAIQNKLLQTVKEILSTSTEQNELKKIFDIQVITPKKDTPLGTKELNSLLQDIFNPNPKKEVIIRGHRLRLKDKIIHVKNQNMYFIPYKEYKKLKHAGYSLEEIRKLNSSANNYIRVFNGNIGVVVDLDEEDEIFVVYYPGLFLEPVSVFYSFDDFKTVVDVGYALTIHKVQGSQFNYVIMPMVNSFYIMLNTNLLYTAITRAIQKVIIIGQPSAIKIACKNIKENKRNTFLSLVEFSS